MAIVFAAMVPHPPLIIPQVGRGEEQLIEKTADAFRSVMLAAAAAQPETVVIISPHAAYAGDYFHISPRSGAAGDLSAFNAASVKANVSYDEEFVRQLCQLAAAEDFPAGTMGEREADLDHASLVPLYFLREACGGSLPCRVVRLGLSGLPLSDHYKLGMMIKETAEKLGRRTVIIASGDLSHVLKEDGPYGFHEEGPIYDKKIMAAMGSGDFGALLEFDADFCEKAAECGHRAFVIMAGSLDRTAVLARALSYEGPFGVGYGVCSYRPLAEDGTRCFLDLFLAAYREKLKEIKAHEDSYVRLARLSLEAYISRGEKIALPASLPREMTETRAGVFVSLKKFGQLRGCIGTISPTTASVADEIIRNARSAAAEDPRFDPISEEELAELVYSVDVLGEAEETSKENLDVKRYGVIVSCGSKRGLLLPNLEGVETVAEQIAIASRKAGIRKGEKVRLMRFEVTRHY